jgi:hypothetical protein
MADTLINKRKKEIPGKIADFLRCTISAILPFFFGIDLSEFSEEFR